MSQTATLAVKLGALFIGYFTALAPIVHVVLVFIAIDFLTGLYASIRVKEIIVSHRLRKTVEKFVFYITALLLAFIFEKEIADWTNLASVVGCFIASVELLSIYENIQKITGLKIASKLKDVIMNAFKNKVSELDSATPPNPPLPNTVSETKEEDIG